MTLAERFAYYTHGLTFERIPDQVIHEAKRRIIDAVACGLGAVREEPLAQARRAAARLAPSGLATLLGTGQRTSPDLAAFVNGYAVRYLDYNDTYLSREALHARASRSVGH
ncbi:MAG: MmgE/PrpD family protein [Armatimonadetes bacterium]|nr:MmgE/PrpD family protein [Armatimonadota bacterium]